MRILIRGTIILLLGDALLLGIAGIASGNRWLQGGAVLAALLCIVVVRFGKAFDRQRAEIAASRAEMRGEAHALADAAKVSRDP